MRYRRIEKKGFDILEVSLDEDDEIIDKALRQSEKKLDYTSRYDPSSKKRTRNEVFNAQVIGTIADICCHSVLKNHLDDGLLVERYDDIRTDDFEEPDDFDIRISNNRGIDRFVEVRSSVCNEIPLMPMLCTWHVLGWYTTKDKPGEPVRDFYIRPIYHFNKFDDEKYVLSNAFEYIKEGSMDLYIIGGATENMMRGSGEVEYGYGLLQEGATYQVLEISEALGIEDFLNTVNRLCT